MVVSALWSAERFLPAKSEIHALVPFEIYLKRCFMQSDGDGVFDKLSLDELIELLVNKTTEYIELMEQKNANAIKLRDLKLELDILHTVINQKKVAD